MTHPMIVHEAKEFAGVFYEKCRSAKFRATWPSQMEYVNRNWTRFVVAVREVYAQMLTRHDVAQNLKDKIYAALIADAGVSTSPDAESPLQLAPNTQAFEGDRAENRLTDQTYGAVDTMRRTLLKSSTAFRRNH